MDANCQGCTFFYHESDTNYSECRSPARDEIEYDDCPGYYSQEDAKADAKNIGEVRY
jgi:hypothetical protein